MKIKYIIGTIVYLYFVIILAMQAFAVNTGANGTFVWGDSNLFGGINTTNYTERNTVGKPYASLASNAIGGLINWTKIVASKTRAEKVAAFQTSNGSLFILNCSGFCSSVTDWTYIGNITRTINASNASYRAFDLAAFDNGDIMVVFANFSTPDKTYYCIWNGSYWSPNGAVCPHARTGIFNPNSTNEINVSVGTPQWITLAARGNKALLGVSGLTGAAVAYFNGSWPASRNVTLNSTQLALANFPAYDLAWENQTAPGSSFSDGIVVYDEFQADGRLWYRMFNGSNDTWTGKKNAHVTTAATNNRWIELASDPRSRRISMITLNALLDTSIYIWKLNNFTEGFTNGVATNIALDATVATAAGKEITTVWAANDTNISTALFLYVDASAFNLTGVCWNPWTNFTPLVSNNIGSPNTNIVTRLVGISSPKNNDSIILRGDNVDDLIATRWNGSGCSHFNFEPVGTTNITNILPDQGGNIQTIPFSFAYDFVTPTPTTDCGFINSNFQLRNNVNSISENCFIINASGVTLDGNGFNVTSNMVGSNIYRKGSAVNNTGFSNVIIKNLNIYNFSTGIFLNSTMNNIIENNFFNDSIYNYSIYAENSTQLNISNNNFFTPDWGNGAAGSLNSKSIFLLYVNNSLIQNNIIRRSSAFSDTISIYHSSYNNITNNNITTSIISGGVTRSAIAVIGNTTRLPNKFSIGNKIDFNRITYVGVVNNIGINITFSQNTNISFNNITMDQGVVIVDSNATIIGNNIL